MKRGFLFGFIMVVSMVCMAQSAVNADQLFTAGNYTVAKQIYEQLTRKYPTNTLYLYRYARCAQEVGEHEIAIEYFLRAGDRYILKHFFLGESYMALWHNKEAIECYEKYLEIASDEERTEYINKQIALAQKRLRYLRRVENISVIDYEELSVKNFLDAYKLSDNAGFLSQDTMGAITFTAQRGDRCILAMKSDSASVLGNRFRLLDKWDKTDTLPDVINMSTEQNYPYCLNDGVTVYFASNHPDGIGGMDIYVTRYNTDAETFTTPENIGFPFNSAANDYMFAIDEENQIGYFATDRFSAEDSVRVYRFFINDPKKYLHDLSADTLALYAQLKLYNTADSLEIFKENTTDTINTQTVIFFVLNDSTVYTSLDDFESSEALKLYNEYTILNAHLTTVCSQLDALRLQYSKADEEQRNNLKQTVLSLEKEKASLSKKIKEIVIKVRTIELKYLLSE